MSEFGFVDDWDGSPPTGHDDAMADDGFLDWEYEVGHDVEIDVPALEGEDFPLDAQLDAEEDSGAIGSETDEASMPTEDSLDLASALAQADAFLAELQVMGRDPDEAGLWQQVRSEANYDGAADTVDYADVSLNPYVSG